MTPHGKATAETMGFPSLINWKDEEDAQVGASFAQLADLMEGRGKTCPICGLPINKRTHPWNRRECRDEKRKTEIEYKISRRGNS